MTKAISAYLLLPVLVAGAILGTFDAQELQKVPNVLVHYRHHQLEHGEQNLSFLQFLVDHFHAGTEQDSEHEDLPLLGGLSAAPAIVPLVVQVTSELSIDSQELPMLVEQSEPQLCPGLMLDVFQPPRVA